MTIRQIEHLEETLISFIDSVAQKQNATPAEIEALPKVASALAEIHKQN